MLFFCIVLLIVGLLPMGIVSYIQYCRQINSIWLTAIGVISSIASIFLISYTYRHIKHNQYKKEYDCIVSCEYNKCIHEVKTNIPEYEAILTGLNISLDKYCSDLADWQYFYMSNDYSKKFICHHEEYGTCLSLKLQIIYTNIISNYEEYIKPEYIN